MEKTPKKPNNEPITLTPEDQEVLDYLSRQAAKGARITEMQQNPSALGDVNGVILTDSEVAERQEELHPAN